MPRPRQDEKANSMYALYLQGFSIEQVAKAFEVTRQSVFKMFSKRDFKLRCKQQLPFVMRGDIKYSLRKNGYYAQTHGSRSYLHRDVWIIYNGQIPSGFDVHHKDGDKANNAIENLELFSVVDHGKHHSKTNDGFKNSQFKKGRVGTFYPRK